MDGSRHPAGSDPDHRHKTPDDLYATRPPWDIGHPQPAFRALADAGYLKGCVLDVGCGTGEHALMAAAVGLEATGVDLAARALRSAQRKAESRKLTARFLQMDARRLTELGSSFDTVIDCGLFHIFDDTDRGAYAESLRSVLNPGGRCFVLCFSDLQSNDNWQHVHRVTQDEIRRTFVDGWRVDSIEPSTIEISVPPFSIRAWLSSLTRT